MTYEDIRYEKKDGVARVTINRPKVLNAFRARTLSEMYSAFRDAWYDRAVGVVVLRGTGDRAFCVGGDQKVRSEGGYDADAEGKPFDVERVHQMIRAVPKPVIAAVNGYAIGGGNVLAALCDLTIAADTARFGQVGPRVGSFDAGFGTAYLSRIVGEKRAREIWYLCRQYSAEEALDLGLVNRVVPAAELDAEVDRWCTEILEKSPTALRFLKLSFNADTDHISGLSSLAMSSLGLYYPTEEAAEGRRAFAEGRAPDFRKLRS
ncbi:MAG: 1,4-dihydroxy-2-naphthoyl-CoA synthase [Myxococcota bacterium]